MQYLIPRFFLLLAICSVCVSACTDGSKATAMKAVAVSVVPDTDGGEVGQLHFLLPKEKLKVFDDGRGFETDIHYPSGLPCQGNNCEIKIDSVRVLVRGERRAHMRSKYLYDALPGPLKQRLAANAVLSGPELKDIGKHSYGEAVWMRLDVNKLPVVVTDPGAWSVAYEAYRQHGKGIEIRYIAHKKLDANFQQLDDFVIAFLNDHLSK